MLSDDHYRAKLQQTTAAIRAWTGFVADVARIDESEHDGAWRLSLDPTSPTACPVELLIHGERRFDLAIDGEHYEDCELDSLDGLLPLLQAVADGHVLRRHRTSAATGLLREVSTVVQLADGSHLELGRSGVIAPGHDEEGTIACDRHYAPYRKPD